MLFRFHHSFFGDANTNMGVSEGEKDREREQKKLEIACESKEQLEQKVSNMKKNEQKKLCDRKANKRTDFITIRVHLAPH